MKKTFTVFALLLAFLNHAHASTISNFTVSNQIVPENVYAATDGYDFSLNSPSGYAVEQDAGFLAPNSTATIVFSVNNSSFGTSSFFQDITVPAFGSAAITNSGGVGLTPVLSANAVPFAGATAWATSHLVVSPETITLTLSNLTPMYAEFSDVVFSTSSNTVATVSVSAVPLPPALPMFAAALLALGVFAWRRRVN